MAKYVIDETTLTEIADEVRNVTGKSNKMKPSEMIAALKNVDVSGGGYDEGYAAGKTDGIEQGKQSEYDRFWDAYQNNGELTNYQDVFGGRGWDDTSYNPKYPIICTGNTHAAYVAFHNCNNITSTKVPIEIRCGVAQSMFANCSTLKTIPYLGIFGATDLGSMFSNCKALEDITIDGSIDVNFNISATAVLTNDSVQSIIDHLKDLTGETSQKVTFHSDVAAKLTDEQYAAISAKNWTC